MDKDKKISLDRTQKIAFSRLLSDLIEADFIVEEGEMDFFEEIISKNGLNISESMLIEAKKMDLAKAVSILKELDKKRRIKIIENLKDLALSDGTCVPLEAIQIFALEQAMEHDAYMYSVPAKDIGIDNMTVIYIENGTNTAIAHAIEENYRSISNEFALAGFNFVYIPFVVDDYRRMKSDYLKKVVRYMIPSTTEKKVDSICSDLQSMTTYRFCRDLLYEKIKMPLLDVKPSLLLKINESAIIDQYDMVDAERTDYANFLRIELECDVLNEIRQLIDSYHNLINCSITIDSKPKTQKFMYSGFHRSLFDLIAYGREQKEYKLVFDFSHRKANVYFEPIDGSGERIPLKLPPQEAALYAMIVKKSFSGQGLDWRDDHIQKKELLVEYNKIYGYIGKGNTAYEYKDRTQVHHIKTKVRAIHCLANMELFVPFYIKHTDGIHSYYKVKAPQKYIQFKD